MINVVLLFCDVVAHAASPRRRVGRPALFAAARSGATHANLTRPTLPLRSPSRWRRFGRNNSGGSPFRAVPRLGGALGRSSGGAGGGCLTGGCGGSSLVSLLSLEHRQLCGQLVSKLTRHQQQGGSFRGVGGFNETGVAAAAEEEEEEAQPLLQLGVVLPRSALPIV